MAATETASTNGHYLTLTAIDADFDLGSEKSLFSIEFYPGASDDELHAYADSGSGPILCKLKSTDGESRIKYFGGRLTRVFIDYDGSTLTAGHAVVIEH